MKPATTAKTTSMTTRRTRLWPSGTWGEGSPHCGQRFAFVEIIALRWDDSLQSASVPATSNEIMTSDAGHTILVVEDNDDVRDLVVEALRRKGYHVTEARNGQEALDALEELGTRPCLVLLDMMMPVMSGPEFLVAIAKDLTLASIPVVVVTAAADARGMQSARRIIKKPVHPDVLVQLAREFCPDGATAA